VLIPSNAITQPAVVRLSVADPLSVYGRSPVTSSDLGLCARNGILRSVQHGLLGGGGGVSSMPWCAGSACHACFASRNLSEMRSLMCTKDMVVCVPTIPAACPASWSARSLPGVPARPLTQAMSTVLFLLALLRAVAHHWTRTA
jgi:hypothetical protein